MAVNGIHETAASDHRLERMAPCPGAMRNPRASCHDERKLIMRDISPIPAMQDKTVRRLLQLTRDGDDARIRTAIVAGADPIARSPDTGYTVVYAGPAKVSRIR